MAYLQGHMLYSCRLFPESCHAADFFRMDTVFFNIRRQMSRK